MVFTERDSLMSSALIYTKDACPYCDRAKSLFQSKGQEYTEMKIGVDVTREEFMNLFPEVRSVPYIIINGEKVGGFNELTEWYNSNGQRKFLSE